MRISIRFLLALTAVAITGCNRQKEKIDIPDIQGIYSDIQYMDSLLQSRQIDSISSVQAEIQTLISSVTGGTQSADQQAVLDSVSQINSRVNDFLRFCTDSKSNLELLRTDLSAVEIQYKSSKIDTRRYITALIESEQILVDIHARFTNDKSLVLRSLTGMGNLKTMLMPIPRNNML